MLFSDTLFLAVFRPWRKSRWHHNKIFHVLSQLVTVCNVNRMLALVHIHPLLFFEQGKLYVPTRTDTESIGICRGFGFHPQQHRDTREQFHGRD